MKKYLLTVILHIMVLALAAQTDPAAQELLNKVSQKYEAYKTIRSDFTLEVKDTQGQAFANSGTMLFNKPQGQYRIQIKDDDIISDGKAVWNISKELKEVQITEADDNPNTIGPNNLFSFYKNGYKYVHMPDEQIKKNGKTEPVKVVELSPIDTRTNYFKIKLRVNKNTHIHDITIFDKSNNRYIYTINTLYVNLNLPKSNFELKKDNYKGYEIIDLR
ncbi:MAG TPA: outer membrane lipoprotein carrier protein LolA [Sphingobacterium sp.]|nr:outer membrane lipoprotein carrier protein LolA [Sphingobacterium sp.]